MGSVTSLQAYNDGDLEEETVSSPSGKGRGGGLVKDTLHREMPVDTGTKVRARGLGWALSRRCSVGGQGGWDQEKQHPASNCMLSPGL